MFVEKTNYLKPYTYSIPNYKSFWDFYMHTSVLYTLTSQNNIEFGTNEVYIYEQM